jgi:aerobic carbon-monoxide dehydrogenase medium subunit
MYPNNFDYYRASTVAEAVEMLQKHEGSKLLAGGHSLVPAMKYRVANPSAVIDISRIEWLREISLRNDGDVMIGAMATHASVARNEMLRQHCAIVAQAAAGIGDQMVRNRGTIGGSVAHADPAADYPTVLRTVGARFIAIGPKGSRAISSESMFTDLFTTALAQDEVLTEVVVNSYGAGTGAYYAKFPHPASGYAVIGAGALVTVANGVCSRVSLVIGGATPNPVRCDAAEAALTGKAPSAANIAAAARLVSGALGEVMGDQFASSEYRGALAATMAERALTEAAARV